MDPSLTFYKDVDEAEAWEVDLTAPPDWEDPKLGSSMKAIGALTVKGNKKADTTRTMLQLVFAIQTHQLDIRTVTFVNCQIKEMGHWCAIALQLTAANRYPLLAVEFEECDIHVGAASNISYMLKANSISGLSFKKCTFQDNAKDLVVTGLRVNKSLREFSETVGPQPTSWLTKGALEMLSVNHEIVELSLDMKNQDCWDVYRAAGCHPTLKSLKFRRAIMDVASVGAIMKLYQDTPSLKSLAFIKCQFTQTSLQFLTEQLSKHVALDYLQLGYCDAKPIKVASLELKWDSLNVKYIEYNSNTFGDGFTSTLLDKIASNYVVADMVLCSVLRDQSDFEKLCGAFFLQNRGPPSLTIDNVGSHATMIVDALLRNTRLRELVIAKVDEDGYVAFARGLANMTALRKLYIGYNNIVNHYSPEFFQALQESLEVNTTLMSLDIRGIGADDGMAKPFIPMIRYFLSINRIGRRSLLTCNRVPIGLFPCVLARCSTDPDGIYFALTGKPDLCQYVSDCRHRKRQLSQDDA